MIPINVISRIQFKKPWLREPNNLFFNYKGILCEIKRNFSGALCGYAYIPYDKVCNKKRKFNYFIMNDLDVHGGITYDNKVESNGKLFYKIGFDCCHSYDYLPKGLNYFSEQLESNYKDINYVTKEIESMVDQIMNKF